MKPNAPLQPRARAKQGLRRPWVTVAAAVAVTTLTLAACGRNVSLRTTRAAGASSAAGSALTMATGGPWGSSWSFNPYSPEFPYNPAGFVYLNLALPRPPSMTGFVPELAQRWVVSGQKLTVYLRPGVRWQNGAPFTSTDVYDTILLDGTAGNAIWDDIRNVSTPSKSTVVLTVRPGKPAELAEVDLFNGVTPYPASVYGRFVTPTLKKDERAYYKENDTNPSAAAGMAAKASMDKVFQALAKFSPKKMVGDGPFKLTGITTAAVKLSKWSGFYRAAKVHVDAISYLNGTTNSGMYADLLSGRTEYSDVYLTPLITKRWLRVPNAHVARSPSFSYTVVFNSHKYPLNNPTVRRALAYVLPRQKMTSFTYGTDHAGAVMTTHPDGLTPDVESQWLTKKQIASLSTYPVDPTKATRLLESVGFKKKGGRWLLPSGTPFTLTMTVPSSGSDEVSSFEVASTALTNFGIKTSVDAVSLAEQSADQYKGSFDLIIGGAFSLDPLVEFDQQMGSGVNYITAGSYKGDRGMGFGPTVAVPGLGRVNVPATLDAESASTPPGARMRQLTWDWARLVEQQMPFLQYASKVYWFAYSTDKFDDWPPTGSEIWKIMGYTELPGLAYAMQEGYVRPKS